MKNLITLAVVVVVGLVAFNYFKTGELTIIPGGSMSDEAREVNRLRGEFRQAAQEYRQAERTAGLSGLDTTSEAESALNTVDGIERDLKKLRGAIEDPEVRTEIDDLLAEIAKYKSSLR